MLRLHTSFSRDKYYNLTLPLHPNQEVLLLKDADQECFAKQTNKHVNKQTNKHESRQTSKNAKKQQVKKETSKQETKKLSKEANK